MQFFCTEFTLCVLKNLVDIMYIVATFCGITSMCKFLLPFSCSSNCVSVYFILLYISYETNDVSFRCVV